MGGRFGHGLLVSTGVLVFGVATSPCADPVSFVYPDPSRTIVVVKAEPCEGELPCGRALPETDPLAAAILSELRDPYHQSMLTVSQALRNLIGDTAGPNVIYASENEGGFARAGLVIKSGDGSLREYPNLAYVDLVLNPERVAAGELDIYSHELGHVMMGLVWDNRWGGWSPKQHVSMGVTDGFTAINEGWGIHFQQLAMDHVPRYRDLLRANQGHKKGSRWLWHSHLDTRLRLFSVQFNDYIHRKVLPEVDTVGMTPAELILLEHTSPLFDPCRLRNAQEMMASEGVIATLFYRITTDTVLQNSYAPAEFYRQFLRENPPASMNPQEIFTPLENELIKSAFCWYSMKDHVDSLDTPFTEYVKERCRLFPGDREELLTLVVATTAGRTVTEDLVPVYERMAYLGTVGRYAEYKQLSREYDSLLAEITSEVIGGTRAIDANLGPQLWVENSGFQIPIYVFFPEPTYPLWIDLNTAGYFDLVTFAGVTPEIARRILAARDRSGHFASMKAAEAAGFPASPR